MGTDIASSGQALRSYALREVYLVDDPLLSPYQPDYYLAAFLQAQERIQAGVILAAHTAFAVDFAPRMALALDSGLVMDCIGCSCESGDFVFSKPVFGGNVVASLKVLSSPAVATIRQRSFEPLPRGNGGTPLIPLAVSLGDVAAQYRVLERHDDADSGPRIEDADIVVAGGRGMGGPEGFASLASLAATLDAAVGASRPPVDLGWVPASYQVGQTAAIVAPRLYLAVGISGSIQHIAGMAGSETIVAINKDPKASIFKIADFGIAARYEDVLPAFHEALKHACRRRP
jgi:electron transfer flavoprotein alpha subunit